MIDVEQVSEEIAQRVAARVVELLPTDPAELAQELAAQAHAERERVRELINLLTDDKLRGSLTAYLDRSGQ